MSPNFKLRAHVIGFNIQSNGRKVGAPTRRRGAPDQAELFAVSTTASSLVPSAPERLLILRHGVVERQLRSARAALSCLSSGRFRSRTSAYKVILPRGDRGGRCCTHVKKLTRKQTLYWAMSLAAHQGKSSLSRQSHYFPLPATPSQLDWIAASDTWSVNRWRERAEHPPLAPVSRRLRAHPFTDKLDCLGVPKRRILEMANHFSAKHRPCASPFRRARCCC